MSLIEQLKADQVVARKARDKDTASSLTTVLGELETETYRGQELTDEFIIRKLKKDIENLKELNTDSAQAEIVLLSGYLPKQMSEEELKSTIESILADAEQPNIGTVMQTLKANYAGLYNGGDASRIAKGILNGNS